MPPSRRSYSLHQKIDIITWHRENGESQAKTARYFNVDKRRISEWNMQYETMIARSQNKY